jgi:hypothetical protein
MVREPDAAEAARFAREKKSLALGIHIDLGEWSYEGGNWVPRYQRVVLEDPVAVEKEVGNKSRCFVTSWAAIHSHRFTPECPCAGTRTRRGDAPGPRPGIPIRHFGPDVRYCGAFYGQTAEGDPLPEGISTEALLAILRSSPASRN